MSGEPHTLAAACTLGFRSAPRCAEILFRKLLDDGCLHFFEVYGSVLELLLETGQRDDIGVTTPNWEPEGIVDAEH
jgi:hypothetical protein